VANPNGSTKTCKLATFAKVLAYDTDDISREYSSLTETDRSVIDEYVTKYQPENWLMFYQELFMRMVRGYDASDKELMHLDTIGVVEASLLSFIDGHMEDRLEPSFDLIHRHLAARYTELLRKSIAHANERENAKAAATLVKVYMSNLLRAEGDFVYSDVFRLIEELYAVACKETDDYVQYATSAIKQCKELMKDSKDKAAKLEMERQNDFERFRNAMHRVKGTLEEMGKTLLEGGQEYGFPIAKRLSDIASQIDADMSYFSDKIEQ
jgi:hypothetical protein